MTSDDTPDSVIEPIGTNGNRKLKEYCTFTFTRQVGLLFPLDVSQVSPFESFPGQVVVVVRFETLIPGGARLDTKLETFALLATQLKDEYVEHDVLPHDEPLTIA